MSEASSDVQCPECGSKRVWRDGVRHLKDGRTVQRWLCRSCGYRFSFSSHSQVKLNIKRQPSKLSESMENLAEADSVNLPAFKPSLKKASFPFREDVGAHDFTNAEKHINSLLLHSRERRVGAGSNPAKNSAPAKAGRLMQKLERKEATGLRGPTENKQAEIKGKLVEFLWWMKKQNYSKATIQTYNSVLTTMAKRNVNIMDPEAVKEYLAKLNSSQAHKHIIAAAYTLFLKFQGLNWDPPRYRLNRKPQTR